MKIRVLVAFLFLFLVVNSFAQNKTNREIIDSIKTSEKNLLAIKEHGVPGLLITKSGDTMKCLVSLRYPYNSLIDPVYQAFKNGSDSIVTLKPSEIKSIGTEFFYLKNIPFYGKEQLLPILSKGKINLYANIEYYRSDIGYAYSTGIIYVLEKMRNQFVYIKSKDFKMMMGHIFFDTPDILKKIGKKGYRFDDMVKIVREYNKRFL